MSFKMHNKTIVFLLIFYFNGVLLVDPLTLDPCEKLVTCRECLRDPGGCVWCHSKNYANVTRCYHESSKRSCPDPVINPGNSAVSSENRDFNYSSGAMTQIKPQKYNMKLRIGKSHNFTFSYKGTKEYPIDIYFLFDASKTMGRARNTTAKEIKKLYQAIQTMTKDVNLGMGTFVDKNTLPYTVDVIKNKSYSFIHRLKMNKDYDQFQEAVDAIPIGVNFDIPECGLEAIAQVLACENLIGWRPQSRKIVVFLTDAPYHAAGDGRSGGIFQPYDGECYTYAVNESYTKELEMDYPSVSMINKLARDKEAYIIFAVDEKVESVYIDLADAISRSKVFQLDDKDDESLVKKLRDIYEDITKQVKLNVKFRRPSDRKYIDIYFDPDCYIDITSACDVIIGKEHKFNGTITLKQFDENYYASVVEISIEGINEKLILNFEAIKDCECEKYKEINSSECHGEIMECGICICSDLRYGDKCACNRITDSDRNTTDDSSCKSDKNSEIVCNNAGTCFCGECQCNDGFKGPYCEFNVNNCTRDASGLLCGGHGDCQFDGTCKCHYGWSDHDCSCYRHIEVCMGGNDKVCNNRGQCGCTSCNCDPIATWDSRKVQDKYCSITPCPDCHDMQCTILADCALCLVRDEQNCACSFTEYNIVKDVEQDLGNNTEWNICSNVRVDVGCYTNFAYKYDEERYRILLMVQKKKDCAASYYIFGGIFLASLLLVGIFTLVAWKLLTEARDRQEYLRFVKDHAESISGPCHNPYYVPATTTFNNPTFGQTSIKYRYNNDIRTKKMWEKQRSNEKNNTDQPVND